MDRLFFCIPLILIAQYSWALRCGGNLVYDNDTQATVLKKCGEPQAKETLTTTQALYNFSGIQYGTAPYLTEVWTYQPSPQSFEYNVYFTNKKVTSITSNLPF